MNSGRLPMGRPTSIDGWAFCCFGSGGGVKPLTKFVGAGGVGRLGGGGTGGRYGCGTVTIGTGTYIVCPPMPLWAATTDWAPSGTRASVVGMSLAANCVLTGERRSSARPARPGFKRMSSRRSSLLSAVADKVLDSAEAPASFAPYWAATIWACSTVDWPGCWFLPNSRRPHSLRQSRRVACGTQLSQPEITHCESIAVQNGAGCPTSWAGTGPAFAGIAGLTCGYGIYGTGTTVSDTTVEVGAHAAGTMTVHSGVAG